MMWNKEIMLWTSVIVFIGSLGPSFMAHAAKATLRVSAEIVTGTGAVNIAAETDGTNSSTVGVSLMDSAQRGLVTIVATSGTKMLVTMDNAILTKSGGSDALTMNSAACAIGNGAPATVGSCSFTMPEPGSAGDESTGVITVIANFN
jgi:hypothetical protein